MTLKQNLISLYHSQGLAPSEIAKKVNCTVRYANQIIGVIRSNGRKLSIPTYLEAKSHGLKTQKQLAQWFHVTDRTIRNFEKAKNIHRIEREWRNFLDNDFLAKLEHDLIEVENLLKLCNPKSPQLDIIVQLLHVLKIRQKGQSERAK